MEEKLKYLESENSILKKQNEELSKEKQALELRLFGYENGLNLSAEKIKDLLESIMVAKKQYDDGLSELRKRNEELNEMVAEKDRLISQEGKRFAKSINKMIGKITKMK